MKHKEVPVRKEFWEKLLDVDMTVSPNATLERIEQPKILQEANDHESNDDESTGSEFNAGELATPVSTPTDSTIEDATIEDESNEDAMDILKAVKEAAAEASQVSPTERVMSALSQSINSETTHAEHANRIQPIANDQEMPKFNGEAISCFLIPDIDIGDPLADSTESADVANVSPDEPLPSNAIIGVDSAVIPSNDALRPDKDLVETIPFDRFETKSLAPPDNNSCQKSVDTPVKKA